MFDRMPKIDLVT